MVASWHREQFNFLVMNDQSEVDLRQQAYPGLKKPAIALREKKINQAELFTEIKSSHFFYILENKAFCFSEDKTRQNLSLTYRLSRSGVRIVVVLSTNIILYSFILFSVSMSNLLLEC